MCLIDGRRDNTNIREIERNSSLKVFTFHTSVNFEFLILTVHIPAQKPSLEFGKHDQKLLHPNGYIIMYFYITFSYYLE